MEAKNITFILRRIVSFFLILCLIPCQPPVWKGVVWAEDFEEYVVQVGDLLSIPAESLNRLSITDPDIADVTDAKPNELTLLGRHAGETALFIWENDRKRNIMVHVVSQDLSLTRRRIESLLDEFKITEVTMHEDVSEGKLIITGEVPEEKMDNYRAVVGMFPDILDLVRQKKIKDLVQIDMQITELGTTLSKAMGVDWSPTAFTATETQPTATGKFQDLFKIGNFNRTPNIIATVNFLLSQGKARVLSKPRVVVTNGKEATFLVGGEIPILTTTTGATGSTTSQNVEYKEYGVSLSVTPTIKAGKVELKLNTEISDVDGSPPKSVTNTNTTAFLTRSAQTELLLDDRQTIVLAGLIKKNRNIQQARVPLLGSVPIVGWLFRSSASPADKDTEVVISITPTIIHSEETGGEPQKTVAKLNLPRSVEPPVEEVASQSTDMTSRDTIGMPPISKNVGTLAVSVPEAVAPYAQAIQAKISSAIAFPYEAQQNGWEGTVKLVLVIKRDGSLRDVFVQESSGYEIFDQDAVNTAQILAPYAPFPDNIKEPELSLTIPIVYSLDSFLKNVANRS